MSEEKIVPITSRNEFLAAIRSAFSAAAERGAREIVMVDPNFADWPLHERAVIETLSAWVDRRRRLTVFAQTFDELARRQSRFVEWRRQWAHVVHGRTDPDLAAEQVPTILWIADVTCVRLLDRVRHRGVMSDRQTDFAELRGEIDALLQRSVEAFPVTTLGL